MENINFIRDSFKKLTEKVNWDVAIPVAMILSSFIALWTIIYFFKKSFKYCKKVEEISRRSSLRRGSSTSSVFFDAKLENYRYAGIVNIFEQERETSNSTIYPRFDRTRLAPIPSLDRPSVTSKYYSGRRGSGLKKDGEGFVEVV